MEFVNSSSISSELFKGLPLSHISFRAPKLPNFEWTMLGDEQIHLKSLTLWLPECTSFPINMVYPNLEKLDISVQAATLTAELFKISNNPILSLTNVRISGFSMVQGTDLSKLAITTLVMHNFNGNIEGLLGFPNRLRNLALESGRLRFIVENTISPLPELEELKIVNCAVKVVSSYAFSGIPKLRFLNVSHNELRSFLIPENEVPV